MSSPISIRDAMADRVLVGDGAMGTQLQALGLEPGSCGEIWNLQFPEKVAGVHRAYLEAGADCVTTNTFGGSRLGLRRHGLEQQAEAINRKAVEIARSAVPTGSGYVLGDIGPFGGLMEPYGTARPEEVRAGFLEQAACLVEAGIDAILIETMTSLEELELAVSAAREAGAPFLIATMAFDAVRNGADFRTMMGVSPEQAAAAMSGWGVDACGCNCGAEVDAQRAVEIIRRFHACCRLPLVAQPNAGSPRLEGDRVIYVQDSGALAQQVEAFVSHGARLIGACCGSTPSHVAAIRKKLG